jgi:hypothetical protein
MLSSSSLRKLMHCTSFLHEIMDKLLAEYGYCTIVRENYIAGGLEIICSRTMCRKNGAKLAILPAFYWAIFEVGAVDKLCRRHSVSWKEVCNALEDTS